MDKRTGFLYTGAISVAVSGTRMRTHQSKTRKIDARFARYKLEIRRSRIDSLGVFALDEIPRGKCVIEYTGRKLSIERALELIPPFDAYLVRSTRRRILDGRVGGSGAELVNHSCDPNLLCKRSRGRLHFWSRRRIRVGEELTLRYAYPFKVIRVPCRCGSKKCRGTLRYLLN